MYTDARFIFKMCNVKRERDDLENDLRQGERVCTANGKVVPLPFWSPNAENDYNMLRELSQGLATIESEDDEDEEWEEQQEGDEDEDDDDDDEDEEAADRWTMRTHHRPTEGFLDVKRKARGRIATWDAISDGNYLFNESANKKIQSAGI